MEGFHSGFHFPFSVVGPLVGVLCEQMSDGSATFKGGLNAVFNRIVRFAGDGHGRFWHGGFVSCEPLRLLDVFSTLDALIDPKYTCPPLGNVIP